MDIWHDEVDYSPLDEAVHEAEVDYANYERAKLRWKASQAKVGALEKEYLIVDPGKRKP